MPRIVQIADKMIGEGEYCFVIAEAGSNHNCTLEQAKQLIDIAATSEVDAVKFQTFQADKIAARTKNEIVNINIAGSRTLHDLYKKLELPREWQKELVNYARDRRVIFLSTPFDEEAVDELDALAVPAFKVASFELVHLPLLKHIARKGKPIILSTAMANLGDIEEAIEAILEENNDQIILLHCGIGYPLEMENVNLAAMDTLRQAFPYPIGYSDHTLGTTIPIAAVARGANVIEKHFTISRNLAGPDHSFALEPHELGAMVQGIRDVNKAIGTPQKRVLVSEITHYQRGRRSIFAKVDIPKGIIITEDMLAILRPGIGLKPKYLHLVVGRAAQVDIKAHTPITMDII
ncbi:N-acetylneuraminate synthase family protein [Chloroflexota bacterium]